MGNYRFRVSDMMPNAWFYRLKELGRNRKHPTSTAAAAAANISQQQQPLKPNQPNSHFSYPRKSCYFTRELIHNSPTNSKSAQPHFPDPPRKSSKQRKLTNRRILRHFSPKLVTSSISADISCKSRATLWTNKSSDTTVDYSASFSGSDSFSPEFRSDRVLPAASFDKMVAWPSSCGCNQVIDSNADGIIIDVDNKSPGTNFDKLDLSDLDLPPIITKPPKFDDKVEDIKNKQTKETTAGYRKSSAKCKETNAHGSLSAKLVKEESVTMKERKSSNSFRRHVNSPGLRLSVNSPRIARRRIQAHGGGRKSVSSSSSSSSGRSLSDSLAIVKSSFDPQRDFRESMVEMIVENNIRASKDLEDLLACYLSLNCDEYHDLIIKVFKQIWLDLNKTPSK